MKITTKALALAIAATGAQADGIKYMSGSFAYGSTSAGGRNFTFGDLQGRLEYQTGNFLIFAHADSKMNSAIGPSNTTSSYGVGVGYQITPSAMAYVGASQLIQPGSRPINAFSVGAQGTFGALTVAGDVLQAQEIGSITVSSLVAEYKASEQFAVGVKRTMSQLPGRSSAYTLAYADYQSGALDVSASVLMSPRINMSNVDVSYEFGGNYRALATVSSTNFGPAKLTTYNVGAGYKIQDNLWVDGRIGSTNLGGRPVTTAYLELSYETGRQTRLIDRARDHERDIMAGSLVNSYYAPYATAGVNPLGFVGP